jgi:uncharacterized protein
MSAEPGTAALTEEQIDHILQSIADSFGQQLRSPSLHWPSEQDLDYQDVTFPALDGVPLEGWFIPAADSDRLIIANHPMGFSRSGIPTHLEPWKSVWALSGNDVEVNLIPDYKILHDAGTTCWPMTCATPGSAPRPTAASPPAGSSRPGTSLAR